MGNWIPDPWIIAGAEKQSLFALLAGTYAEIFAPPAPHGLMVTNLLTIPLYCNPTPSQVPSNLRAQIKKKSTLFT